MSEEAGRGRNRRCGIATLDCTSEVNSAAEEYPIDVSSILVPRRRVSHALGFPDLEGTGVIGFAQVVSTVRASEERQVSSNARTKHWCYQKSASVAATCRRTVGGGCRPRPGVRLVDSVAHRSCTVCRRRSPPTAGGRSVRTHRGNARRAEPCSAGHIPGGRPRILTVGPKKSYPDNAIEGGDDNQSGVEVGPA